MIYQKDYDKNILRKNRKDCSWTGYNEILEGLKVFLNEQSKYLIFGKQTSNLGRAIYEWNKETDYNATENNGINILGHRIGDKTKILPVYKPLLEDYIPQD